jgi:hypothetical protein
MLIDMTAPMKIQLIWLGGDLGVFASEGKGHGRGSPQPGAIAFATQPVQETVNRVRLPQIIHFAIG